VPPALAVPVDHELAGQSVNGNVQARRARVAQRIVDDNNAIAAVCAEYIHCRYDGGRTYATPFARGDVSSIDYFHPSVAGQAKLASVTWASTFDFTDHVAPVSSASSSCGVVAISATDNIGVAGIEVRSPSSSWTRYAGPFGLSTGASADYRAVDVNGNIEASHTITG
jgi:hypothetical protein